MNTLFRLSDVFAGPICFVILLMIFSFVVKKYQNDEIKKLFVSAFYFKMFCTLAYTIVNSFYYRGGDTEMYYQCTQFLRNAVLDDSDNILKVFTTNQINVKTPLMNYFIFTDSKYPVFEAMHSPGNFLVPKIALVPLLVFNNSYLCTAMFFSFFALGGAIRLFKVFYHYYPGYRRELAFAILFLPSVGYWSAGLMKDPLCFGTVGYIIYGFFCIAIKRNNYVSSILWIAISVFLLIYMKVYILLALAPAIVLWLFTEFNKVVDNKTLRSIMAIITFIIGVFLAVVLVNYVTSDESLKQFRLDAISESSAQQRSLYESFGESYEGSYYKIATSNPFLLALNGIAATLFRPFLWEINSITALLSSLESLFFLYITILLMAKAGFLNFFRNTFRQPPLLMCFVFAIIFAAAVGSTALNFGSLSRYKIPCLPFYLIIILILYRQSNLEYPTWFKRLLGYKPQLRRTKQAF